MNEAFEQRYTLYERLGTGATSSVYRAWDKTLEREVAVKFFTASILRPDAAQSLQKDLIRESQNANALVHPHICRFYAAGITEAGNPYFVMELVDGKSLESLIHTQGALPLDQSLSIGRQICSAVAYMHTCGMVHRDLKPANIMLCRSSESEELLVKLVDFGLSKLLFPNQTVTETATGVAIGTPGYMSPEQCIGKRVDQRSDVFALGAVLYECFSGTQAFGAEAANDAMMKVLSSDPLPFSVVCPELMIPSSIENCTFRALSKNPDDRYQSVQDMLTDIESISGALAAGTSLPPIQPPSKRRSMQVTGHSRKAARSSLASWLAVAAFILIFGVAAIWLADRNLLGPAAPTASLQTSSVQFYEEARRVYPKESIILGRTPLSEASKIVATSPEAIQLLSDALARDQIDHKLSNEQRLFACEQVMAADMIANHWTRLLALERTFSDLDFALDPERVVKLKLAYATALMNSSQTAKAIQYCDSLARSCPGHQKYRVFIKLSVIYDAMHELNQAEHYMQSAMDCAPLTNPKRNVLYLLLCALFKEKHWDAARQLCEANSTLIESGGAPSQAAFYALQAIICLELHDWQEANRYIRAYKCLPRVDEQIDMQFRLLDAATKLPGGSDQDKENMRQLLEEICRNPDGIHINCLSSIARETAYLKLTYLNSVAQTALMRSSVANQRSAWSL